VTFIPRTEAEIRQSLLARALAYSGLTDLYEGGVALELLLAVAQSLARAEQSLQQVANLGDLERCVGEDLDERAAEALPDALARQAATAATTLLIFSRAAGDTVGATAIPAGQVVARASDGALFATTATGTVPNGALASGLVPAVAQVAGAAGDCGVGTLTVLKSPPPRIVAVTNPTPATGGLDSESDASLRSRVRQRCRSLARCNPAAIDTLVRAYVNGAGQQARFLKLVESPPRGDLWLDDGTGALDQYTAVPAGDELIESAPAGETVLYLPHIAIRDVPTSLFLVPAFGLPSTLLLAAGDYTVEAPWGQIRLAVPLAAGDHVHAGAYTYYTGLVADVQRLLEGDPYDPVTSPGCRAAGTALRARPATVQNVPLTLDVTWQGGLSEADLTAAETAVTDALLALVNGLDIGQPLYVARLIDAAMDVAEVENVRVVLPAADVYVAVDRVLRSSATLVTLL
jgi:uncharacterized phage protein gp47/JayE